MRQAAVMLVIKDGLILGITRRSDKTKYGLLGGKVSLNETPQQAAIRESLEEAGIIVKSCIEIYKRIEPGDGSLNGEDFHSTCFYATDWSGDPQDSEEGNVKWLTVDEITCTKAAFGDYNTKTLNVFKTIFPNIKLIGE